MDGDGTAIAGVRPVPDLVQELIAGEDLTRVSGQELQEVEFPRGEFDAGVADFDLPTIRPNRHRAEAKRIALGRRRRHRTPEDGLDTRDQLARTEWFGDVIIGADAESDDRIG